MLKVKMGNIKKVENMESINGNLVPNQFILWTESGKVFQSYNSIIVAIVDGIVYLDEVYYNYSRTTSKYRNQFLRRTTKEIEQRIKEGTYILTNLN